MRLIKDKPSIDFLSRSRRNVAVGISILVVVISFVSFATRGLNLGIDFTGGVLLEVRYPQEADLVDIRSKLNDAGFEQYVVQAFGTPTDVLVRLPPQIGEDSNAIRDRLFGVLSGGDSRVDLTSYRPQNRLTSIGRAEIPRHNGDQMPPRLEISLDRAHNMTLRAIFLEWRIHYDSVKFLTGDRGVVRQEIANLDLGRTVWCRVRVLGQPRHELKSRDASPRRHDRLHRSQ